MIRQIPQRQNAYLTFNRLFGWNSWSNFSRPWERGSGKLYTCKSKRPYLERLGTQALDYDEIHFEQNTKRSDFKSVIFHYQIKGIIEMIKRDRKHNWECHQKHESVIGNMIGSKIGRTCYRSFSTDLIKFHASTNSSFLWVYVSSASQTCFLCLCISMDECVLTFKLLPWFSLKKNFRDCFFYFQQELSATVRNLGATVTKLLLDNEVSSHNQTEKSSWFVWWLLCWLSRSN